MSTENDSNANLEPNQSLWKPTVKLEAPRTIRTTSSLLKHGGNAAIWWLTDYQCHFLKYRWISKFNVLQFVHSRLCCTDCRVCFFFSPATALWATCCPSSHPRRVFSSACEASFPPGPCPPCFLVFLKRSLFLRASPICGRGGRGDSTGGKPSHLSSQINLAPPFHPSRTINFTRTYTHPAPHRLQPPFWCLFSPCAHVLRENKAGAGRRWCPPPPTNPPGLWEDAREPSRHRSTCKLRNRVAPL